MGNRSMKSIYKAGSVLVLGLRLQGYFLWKVLSGGIILGIFPAFLGLYRLIFKCINEKNIYDIRIKDEMKKFNKKEFWQINLLGYVFSLGGTILLINLNISRNYLENWFLHIMLLLFIVLVFGTSQYIIPIFAKYELPMKQYVYQAFLFFVLNIAESIAIILGVIIAAIIGILVPMIGVFAGIPLLFFPYVWFSRLAVQKAEATLYSEGV